MKWPWEDCRFRLIRRKGENHEAGGVGRDLSRSLVARICAAYTAFTKR